MIVLTAEMRAAAARRMGVDDLDPWMEAALVDVLALVDRDHVVTPRPAELCGSRGFAGGSGCWLEKGHEGDHEWSRTVKVKWVCQKCGGPLSRCESCKEPSLCGEGWCAEHMPDGTVISFEELLEADPDVIDPLWAAMSDQELDAVAVAFTGQGSRSGKNIWTRNETGRRVAARFDLGGWKDGQEPDQPYAATSFMVVHVRAGLRQWRDTALVQATGLPTAYANDLFPGGYTGEDLTASSTGVDVDRIAANIAATVAHRDKVTVVGVREMLLRQRGVMRDRVRRLTSDAASSVAELEARLRAERATRDGLLWQVIGFGEQPEHNADGTLNYAELGRLGSMSRVAAGQKFKTDDPQPDGLEPIAAERAEVG